MLDAEIPSLQVLAELRDNASEEFELAADIRDKLRGIE